MGAEGTGLNRDTLTGILGAVVLVAAMAGVFLYERGQFQEYALDWQMSETGTQDFPGSTLQEGNSDSHTVIIEDGTLSRVRATVTWTDDVGEPDTLNVDVEGPGDEMAGSDSGSSSPLEATADVTEAPSMATASGRTAADAEEQAANAVASEAGQGTWTITVTLESAPGEPDDGIPVTEEAADGSQSYSLTVAWDVWDPVAQG